MSENYCKKSPCKKCPYRKDAPLRLWSVQEFTDLIKNESSEMGAIYGCHNKDGKICTGWLMDQDRRNLPSIQLRISLSKNNISREFLDSLISDYELYPSIKDMIIANYPELNNKVKRLDK